MRHKKHHSKLSRPTGHRKALIRNLTRALVLSPNGRIETTVIKAKALRPFVESLITLAKKGTLHHRRLAFSRVGNKHVVHRLFEELAPLFQDREGGYTRVIRTRNRAGDGAEMAIIELVAWPAGEEAEASSTEEAAAN